MLALFFFVLILGTSTLLTSISGRSFTELIVPGEKKGSIFPDLETGRQSAGNPAGKIKGLDQFLQERLAVLRRVTFPSNGDPARAGDGTNLKIWTLKFLSGIMGVKTSDLKTFLSLPGGGLPKDVKVLPVAGSRLAHGPGPGDKVAKEGILTPPSPPSPDVPEPSPEGSRPPGHEPGFDILRPFRRSQGPPTVLIYHSHSSEAYRPTSGANYVWGKDEGVIKVGDRLAQVLTDRYGIGVIHSRKIHDYPVWRDAYANSSKTVAEYLKQNQSIEIVLDLHRDSSPGLTPEVTTAEIKGKKVARVFIVVTTDAFGLPHPNWQENFAFARYLQGKMEEMYPGLSRGIDLRQDGRWNQHLHPRSIILEIGSVDNSREEAERSAELVADVLSQVMKDLEIR